MSRYDYAVPSSGMQYCLEWLDFKRVPWNDSIHFKGIVDMHYIELASISIIILTTPLHCASAGHKSVKNGSNWGEIETVWCSGPTAGQSGN